MNDIGDTERFWRDFLSGARFRSEYVEFVRDAHYSCDWNVEKRKSIRKEVLKRLSERKDIDLIIAMGTWAGQDLATSEHHIPVVSMSVSDAAVSGIVPGVNDSGSDHVHARVNPTRFRRQLALFHDTVGFKKLGVYYNDDKVGWTYAAMDDVIFMSGKKGFEINACKLRSYDEKNTDMDHAQATVCMKKLAPLVDAVYLTANSAFALEKAAGAVRRPCPNCETVLHNQAKVE